MDIIKNFNWKSMGSKNNLYDVHKFYCPEEKRLDKELRNVFVKGTMTDIRSDFQVGNIKTFLLKTWRYNQNSILSEIKASHAILCEWCQSNLWSVNTFVSVVHWKVTRYEETFNHFKKEEI